MTVLLSSALFAQQPPVSVGPNIHVSVARPNSVHNEVVVAADPASVAHLLVGSMVLLANSEEHFVAGYASFDGGTTWKPVLSDSGAGRYADPIAAYGLDGGAVFGELAGNVRSDSSLFGWYSEDAGTRWTRSRFADSLRPHMDRPFFGVDHTSSPFRGRVYIAASRILLRPTRSAVALWHSRDGGASYDRAVVTPEYPGVTVLGGVTTLTDGTVAIVVKAALLRDTPVSATVRAATARYDIQLLLSRDGGATLETPRAVAEMHGTGVTASIDSDRGSRWFRDRVYVVWNDTRSGERSQPLLTYSDDRGKSWSIPRIVNDDRLPWPGEGPKRNTAKAVVAVNRDGVVGVMWQDKREAGHGDDPYECEYDIRFAASFDGGETFGPSVRVNKQRRTFGASERWVLLTRYDSLPVGATLRVRRYDWCSGGHTNGLAADAQGRFHAVWVDNRTGISQVWTAPILVSGPVMKHGDADLSGRRDVTRDVEVNFEADFLPQRGMLMVRARLVKRSGVVLRGRVSLRALSISSPLGTVSAVNSDNRIAGDGARWDFEMDKVSGERVLVFRIERPQSLKDWMKGTGGTFGLLDVRVQILAP